jgi:hypothetical protein
MQVLQRHLFLSYKLDFVKQPSFGRACLYATLRRLMQLNGITEEQMSSLSLWQEKAGNAS